MPNPDIIEMAGNCPRCQRPCEGYRIVPPESLIAIVCKPCQTMTLIVRGWDICVASVEWWDMVTETLREMARGLVPN